MSDGLEPSADFFDVWPTGPEPSSEILDPSPSEALDQLTGSFFVGDEWSSIPPPASQPAPAVVAPPEPLAHEQARPKRGTTQRASSKHRRGSPWRLPLARRRAAIVAAAVVGVVVISSAYLYYQATRARHSLLEARTAVGQLRAELRSGDVSRVGTLEAEIRHEAATARNKTNGPLWTMASAMPFLGTDLKDASALASTVDDVAQNELPSLASAASALSPSQLRRPDGSLNVAALQSAQPAVVNAMGSIDQAIGRIQGLTSPHLGSVNSAKKQLASQLISIRGDLTGADHALNVLVPILAPAGPRTYFIAFQNPAESHGTGGLIGTFALLRADHGRASLTKTGTDNDLNAASGGAHEVDVDLPAGYHPTWGQWDPTNDWRDLNIDPNFPDAGKIIEAKYEAQFGVHLDGAIALDPYVLAALIGPTGTLNLPDGTSVTGAQLPQYMLNTLYFRYANAYDTRKVLLTQIVQLAFDHFLHAPLDGGLLGRVEKVAGTGHVQVWSAHADEENAIRLTEVSGAIPATTGPFAFFSTLNTSRDKADYFLDRSLSYFTGACPGRGGTRNATITVTLTNQVPLNEPAVVNGRFDLQPKPPVVPPGQTQEYVSVFTTQGAQLITATVNDAAVNPDAGIEEGHPVFGLRIELPRNVPVRLVLHLVEPAAGKVTVWRPTPLARSEHIATNVPVCS